MNHLLKKINSLSNKEIVIILSIIALIKLVVLLLFVRDFQLWEDHYIALNIVQEGESYIYSDGIKSHTFQFPVFPFIVSILYTVFGVFPIAVAILNIFLSSITAWFLYNISLYFISYFKLPSKTTQYKNLIALLTTLGFCLHPAIAYYAITKVHPFTMDMFMLFFSLHVILRYVVNSTQKNLWLCVIVIGLTVLTRATLVVSTIPLMLLLWEKSGFTKMVKQVLIIGLLAFTTNIPWLARNYYQDGIIGYESSALKDLWKGSLANSEGSNYLKDGKNYYAALTHEEIVTLQKCTPHEQQQFFYEKWKGNVKNDPVGFTSLFFVKLYNFWGFREHLGNEYPPAVRKWIPLYKVSYCMMLLLSGISIFIIRKRIFILLSIPIALSLIQSFFYVETRHRLIIEPILLFLADISMVALFTYRKSDFGQES